MLQNFAAARRRQQNEALLEFLNPKLNIFTELEAAPVRGSEPALRPASHMK
jgi:hypothetical protein